MFSNYQNLNKDKQYKNKEIKLLKHPKEYNLFFEQNYHASHTHLKESLFAIGFIYHHTKSCLTYTCFSPAYCNCCTILQQNLITMCILIYVDLQHLLHGSYKMILLHCRTISISLKVLPFCWLRGYMGGVLMWLK